MWVEPKQYKIVGKVLGCARRRAHVTQQELADLLGKPQSFISAYENGQRRVDLLEFLKICDALRADPASILAGIAAVLAG